MTAVNKTKKISVAKKPHNQKTSVIPMKDQKILWSRAAGLCSICRKKLTLDTSQKDSVTLGQMCHIVGEKKSKSNARGLSSMPLSDRNKYSNLILLCGHHHIEIDRHEKKYTIELLHSIKDSHEIWVEEKLSQHGMQANDLAYTSLIDTLTVALQIDNWDWFVDNAVRQLVHESFIDARDIIAERQLAFIFPKSNPSLNRSLNKVMSTFSSYIDQYLSLAIQAENSGDFFRADMSYKRIYMNPNYDYFSKQHELWARMNFVLLCNYTIALNEFSDAVRKFYNPKYFLERGRFLITDQLGTHNGGIPQIFLPKQNLVSKWIRLLTKEKKDFETKFKLRTSG